MLSYVILIYRVCSIPPVLVLKTSLSIPSTRKRLTPTRSLAVTLNSFLGKRVQKNRRVCGGIGRKTRRQNASMKPFRPKKRAASLIQPSTVVSDPNLQCSYSCISNCNGLKTRKHIVMSIGFSQDFAGFTAIIGLRNCPIAH